MPKRRRRRRSVRWASVFWLMFFANVGLGLAFSPITSLERVRVVGAQTFDKDRISRALQELRDVPCARVDAYSVESRCLLLPEARSAELTRNVFRRGLLVIAYRRPVAWVVGYPSVALSSEGILYRAGSPQAGLPRVKIPASASAPHLSLCLGWDGHSLAYVCQKVVAIEHMQNTVVEVDSRGSLCLNNGIGLRVVLGPAERLDEKLEKLASILRERPGTLQDVKVLNLVSPAQAVMVKRYQGAKP